MTKIFSNKFFLISILLIAFFLRFWGIWRLDLFTYDQARDATYVRRIFTEHKIPLIGPQSSIPGIALGPGYYYLVSIPFLLFGFNPTGIDIFTAFLGVATVWLLYKFIESKSDQFTALLVASLYAVSPIVVELSRRSWNLATLPFFSLLIIYFSSEIVFKKEKILKNFLWLSFCLGLAIQLHYSALLLIPAVILNLFIFARKKLFANTKSIFLAILLFVLLVSPLIFFNFRHDGLMVKAIQTQFFQESKNITTLGQKISSFFVSVWHLFEGTFLYNLRPFSFLVMAFIGVCSLIFLITKKTEKKGFWFLIVFLFFGVFGSLFYPKGFSFFYLVFLFPVPFLIFAEVLFFVNRKSKPFKKILLILTIVILGISLFIESWKIVFRLPVRTRNDFKSVAQVIANDLEKGQKFNLVASYYSPGNWENYYQKGIVRADIRWDHNAVDYGFFVESLGFKPLSWDNFREAEVLYLISEVEVKNPESINFWEINEFGKRILIKNWQANERTRVFKFIKNEN